MPAGWSQFFDDIWVECDFGNWEGFTPTEVPENILMTGTRGSPRSPIDRAAENPALVYSRR
jgi:hypothetical protein